MFFEIFLILIKGVFAILFMEKKRSSVYFAFFDFNPIVYTTSETTVGGLVFTKKGDLQVEAAIGACITNIIGNTILAPEPGCRVLRFLSEFHILYFICCGHGLEYNIYYVNYNCRSLCY